MFKPMTNAFALAGCVLSRIFNERSLNPLHAIFKLCAQKAIPSASQEPRALRDERQDIRHQERVPVPPLHEKIHATWSESTHQPKPG